MDSEINFERLQKKHTKTLIGSTVRNESPAGVRDDEEATPEGKADSEMGDENQSADLKDQEDELDRLLSQGVADLASEAEAMKAKMKKHSEELKSANSRRRGSDIETIREDDQERVAPAASYPDTAFAHEPRSVKTGGDDGVAAPTKVEYFKPHEMPTPKEIVEEVNAGSYTSPEREDKTTTGSDESQGKKRAQLEEKAAEEDEEERKLDKEIAKKLHMNVTKLGVDVPDSTIENDSIYIPPAAMSDGSSSRLLREQERSLSRDHHKNDTALKRPALPHLASGESYHGGIYNKDYYKEGFPLTDTPEDSEPVERKPRHEPGTVKNLNASSLNYLRSLSTSRARADNDRRAMGVDVNDQEDLKETGGLIGDGNMTQTADLEEAMDSILSEVSSIAKPSDEHNLAAGTTLPLSAESLKKKKGTDGKMNEIDEKNVEETAEETEKIEKTAEKTVENTTDTSSETSQKQTAQEKDLGKDTQKKDSDERSEAKKEPEVTQRKSENVSESDNTKKQNIKEPNSVDLGEQASKEKADTSLNADFKEGTEDHPKSESGEKTTSEKKGSVEPVSSEEDSAESSVKKSEKSEQVEDDAETKASKESVVDDSAVKEEGERKDEPKEQQKSKESSEEQANAKDNSDDSPSSKNDENKQISDDSDLGAEDKELEQKDDVKKTDVALNEKGTDAEKKTSVANTDVKDETSEDVTDAESSKEASKADKAGESKSKSDDEAIEGSKVVEANTDEPKVTTKDDKKAENDSVKSSNSEVEKDDINDVNGQEKITETNKDESSGDSANAKTKDEKEESSTEKEDTEKNDIEENDIAKNDAEKEDIEEKSTKTETENQEDEKKETDSETGDKDLEESKVAETEDNAEIKGDAKTKDEEATVIASSEPVKKEKIVETEEKTEKTEKAEETEKVEETEKTEETNKDESSNDDIERLIAEVEREQKALESKSHQTGSKGSVRVAKEQKMTFEDEPVYLYTSFAGGMQVASRTRRMETILAANKIKFQYKDMGTDPQAKRIWKTFSQGKALPGIVRGKDDFIGNWEDIEEANEDYAVRQLIYETY